MTSIYVPTLSEIIEVAESRGDNSEAPSLWRDVVGDWPLQHKGGLAAWDMSGYGNNGTLTNMDPATDWVLSEMGRALEFNGVDQYATIPHAADFDTGTGPLSILVWAAVGTQDAAKTALVSKWSAPTGFWLQIVSQKVDFAPGGQLDGLVVSSFNVDDGILRFYAGVREHTGANGCKLYIDGQLDSQGTCATSNSNLNLLRIGNFAIAGREFLGSIASVAIFSRALTPGEIQDLFARPWARHTLRTKVLPAAVAPAAGSLLTRIQTEGLYVGSAT